MSDEDKVEQAGTEQEVEGQSQQVEQSEDLQVEESEGTGGENGEEKMAL